MRYSARSRVSILNVEACDLPVPQYDERDFNVPAFELTNEVGRAAAQEALTARLADASRYPEQGAPATDLRDATDPVVQSVIRHRGTATTDSAVS